MQNVGYYNGQIGKLSEINIPLLDRGYYFGDGVYDAAYSLDYNIIFLDEHIDRFYKSAELINIIIPMCKKEFKELIINLSKLVEDGDQFVYFQVTRGTAIREHIYLPQIRPNLTIMIKPKKMMNKSTKIKTILVEDKRHYMCNVKTLNLLQNVLAAQKAYEEDAYEAIFHRGNIVTECSHSNIHIIKNERLITAPLDNLILPGVTRNHLLKVARLLGYDVEERKYSTNELFEADEVFVTAAGMMCNSVNYINKIPVGGKNNHMFRVIQDKMFNIN